MNILFISSRFPYPPTKGDKIRAYYPIKYLSNEHCIDLVSFTDEKISNDDIAEMKKYCRNIDIVNINKYYFLFKMALGIFSPIPSQVMCYRSKKMSRTIRRYISTNKYDAVHFVCGRIAGDVDMTGELPALLDWIDALSLSTKRLWETEKNIFKKYLYLNEWKKITNFEQEYADRFQRAIITSEIDKKVISKENIEVIPNGVDTDIFTPAHSVSKDIDLIFTGNMGYSSNITAVDFFCNEILPIIMKKMPDIKFYIVGINPSSKVRKYHNGKNIFVTGFIPDIVELLNKTKVYVAPLKSGAGIQNKILEAMSCGLPVVSTSIGNAGIQAIDGESMIVADSPELFAEEVEKLLLNEDNRFMLGKKARDFVSEKYSWTSVRDKLNEIYQSMITNI